MMKLRYPILILALFAAACNLSPRLITEPEAPAAPAQEQAPAESQPTAEIPAPPEDAPTAGEPAAPTMEMAAPDCLGSEISPIGQSIADDYESADYDQVMTWFCSGAEFEDILVALETETQTEATAEEMLLMLADGFTWEEIWLLVGLTD